MSQERWDVVLTFLTGPLSFQGDVVCRGPVVRLGVSPGPGGVVLDGYRGLDDRQAVITAYDGGSVAIAPVGNNQVRVATHANQNWVDVHPIREPVQLSPGDAFHLGPPDRGVSVTFVEARRLGLWEEQQILSEAAAAHPLVEPTEVKNLDTRQGIPRWFIPSILVVGIATAVAISFRTVSTESEREVAELGAPDGEESYERVDDTIVVPPEVLEGLYGPFQDFVMKPNSDAAGDPSLLDPTNWDQRFLEYVGKSVQAHANRRVWARLEQISDEYAYVVTQLKEAELPVVLAGIPYHESRYRSSNQSPACAEGYWQFQPEVANRMGLEVGTCSYKSAYRGSYNVGAETVVPRNALKNARYVDSSGDGYRCKIKVRGCTPDDRRDLGRSTEAALEMFAEGPMKDSLFRDSGVVVQATILTHVAGYDDTLVPGYVGKRRSSNILPALETFIARNGEGQASSFYGSSITCVGQEWAGIANYNERCGSVLLNAAQHYAYSVIAVHLLAVCYYGKNYGSEEAFKGWKQRYGGEGAFCSTISVPTAEQARGWGGQ